jgi:hypothetical protein
MQLPTLEEIEATLSGRKQTAIVFFLDETFEELEHDATTTVLEAVEYLAGIIKLQNYQTFTLYECRKVTILSHPHSVHGDVNPAAVMRPMLCPCIVSTPWPDNELDKNLMWLLQVIKTAETGAPVADEHYILDDNKYISDIIQEFKAAKSRDFQSKILFKKRMFRETDETITEPQFVTLSYVQVCRLLVPLRITSNMSQGISFYYASMMCDGQPSPRISLLQAQHDYLAGNYPVVREDAAQMCALQMQAEAGPTMLEGADSLDSAIERFVHKQVLHMCSKMLMLAPVYM